MVSHSKSAEAQRRANKKYYDANQEKMQSDARATYYKNNEARLKKLAKSKQRTYEESTIRYVRMLFR